MQWPFLFTSEREHGGAAGELEFLIGDRRQNAALHADHRADKRVDDHEESELRSILSHAKPNADRPIVRDGRIHA
jgi:hypothetical protein